MDNKCSCGVFNEINAKFCKKCGKSLQYPVKNKENRCQNGHIMDPSWDECPICVEGSKNENQKPMTKSAEKMVQAPTKFEQQNNIEQKIFVDNNSSKPIAQKKNVQKGTEIIMPNKNKIDDLTQAGRLSGFLVTYSHNTLGESYQIFSGKTKIGRDINQDICISSDKHISSEHASLLFKNGTCEIIDNMSSNGTFINGVETNQRVELKNYDIIKLGKTEFRFILAEPPVDNIFEDSDCKSKEIEENNRI